MTSMCTSTQGEDTLGDVMIVLNEKVGERIIERIVESIDEIVL